MPPCYAGEGPIQPRGRRGPGRSLPGYVGSLSRDQKMATSGQNGYFRPEWLLFGQMGQVCHVSVLLSFSGSLTAVSCPFCASGPVLSPESVRGRGVRGVSPGLKRGPGPSVRALARLDKWVPAVAGTPVESGVGDPVTTCPAVSRAPRTGWGPP